MTDEYGLAQLKPSEITTVTTVATTAHLLVVVGGIPKKITLANLLTVMNTNLTFLALSDTFAAYNDGDTLKSTATAVELVTV